MTRIKFIQAAVLLSVINSAVLATAHKPSPALTTQTTGWLIGTVVDMSDARVPQAKVVIDGEGATRTAITEEDGTYQSELPPGTYRIRVESPGFCSVRRAAFRIHPSATTMINQTLIPCPFANQLTIVDGQYKGEVDRYIDPFKEEVFPIRHSPGTPLELLIRYGARRKDKNILEYQGSVISYNEYADNPEGSVRRNKYVGATISYDALMIRADKVRLDPGAFRLEAEGNVVVEDNKRCVRVRRAVIDLRTGEPKLEFTQ